MKLILDNILGPCPAARGILVPQQGIEPASLTLEGGLLTSGPLWKTLWYLLYTHTH